MLSSHLSHLSEHAYLITFVMQDNVCKLLNKAYICSERFWYTSMNMYICNFRPSDPFRSIFFSYGIASFSITRSCMRGRRQQPPGAKQLWRVTAWLSVWCDEMKGWVWRTYSNIVRTLTNPDRNFGFDYICDSRCSFKGSYVAVQAHEETCAVLDDNDKSDDGKSDQGPSGEDSGDSSDEGGYILYFRKYV
jgi:hypothetical protein